jgi:hypothetical protein
LAVAELELQDHPLVHKELMVLIQLSLQVVQLIHQRVVEQVVIMQEVPLQ